jgi:hypothetical protein
MAATRPPGERGPDETLQMPQLSEGRLVMGRGARVTENTLELRYLERKTVFLGSKLNRVLHSQDMREKPGETAAALLYIVADYLREDVGLQYAGKFLDTFHIDNVPREGMLAWAQEADPESRWEAIGRTMKFSAPEARRIAAELRLTHADRDAAAKRTADSLTAAYEGIGGGLDAERQSLLDRYLKAAPEGFSFPIKFTNAAMNVTGRCGVGCGHCQACHRSRDLPREARRRIWDGLLAYAGEKRIMAVASGGEPFLEPEDALHIIRNSRTETHVTTNAAWAKDIAETRRIVKAVSEAAAESRAKGGKLALGISFDAFHQEVVRAPDGSLRERVPVANVANVLQAIVEDAPDVAAQLVVCLTPEDGKLMWALDDEMRRRGYEIRLADAGDKRLRYVRKDADGGTGDVDVNTREIVVLRRLDGAPVAEHNITIDKDRLRPLGLARGLDDAEYVHYRKPDMDLLLADREFSVEAPLLAVDGEGKVFISCNSIGGDFLSVGNAAKTPLADIVSRAQRDPLVMAMGSFPRALVKLMTLADPDVLDEVRGEPNASTAVSRIIESPARRLFLTKALIQQFAMQGLIGDAYKPDFGILPDMGLDVTPSALIREYWRNRHAEA